MGTRPADCSAAARAASRDRYALANPTALLPTGGRLVAVHGTRDETVPVEMSRRYVDRARAAGDQVELVEIAGCGHYELIDPLSRGLADGPGRHRHTPLPASRPACARTQSWPYDVGLE